MTIADNWKRVVENVFSAAQKTKRDPKLIRIVAISKGMDLSKLKEAYQVGARIFGENYLQEALPKMEAFPEKAEWHFVGSLQSNKAKKAAEKFSMIHSVDRWSLAEALSKSGKASSLLMEVNLAKEESKSGVTRENIRPLLERISKDTNLTISGLMVFPPLFEDPEKSRGYFQEAKNLSHEIAEWSLPRIEMRELSMGVSHDYEVAVEEGATLVRVGTAIFGPRS